MNDTQFEEFLYLIRKSIAVNFEKGQLLSKKQADEVKRWIDAGAAPDRGLYNE